MSFPRYERYKDSGVEWLGEVPATWSIRRMKNLFEIKKRIAGETGYDILSITQNGIKIKDVESNEGQVAMDYAKYQFVYPGDYAMNHMDLLTGYIDISKLDGVTSPDYRVFSIRNPDLCHPGYFLRLFQSAYHLKIFYAFGQGASQFGRWRLPTEAFNQFSLPYPTLSEQARISDFLDQETAKIDGLIEEQRRLIELLKEKRQAVISHAVTKGLNPNAPMKDSGIDELGKVRSHWTVSLLKHVTKNVTDGAHVSPDPENGEYPFVSTVNVVDGTIDFSNALLTSADSYASLVAYGCRPQEGDVLFSKDGTIGKTVLVEDEADFVVASSLIIIRPDRSYIVSAFLDFLCQGSAVQGQVTSVSKGAGLPRLSISNLCRVWIAHPPLKEQQQIVDYLRTQIDKFKELIVYAAMAVKFLEERRSALISAAVTGKIDVRNYVPKEAA